MSIITMLTFKTSLNILFIRHFDRMAAISETKVMAWMCVTTLVSTVAHIIEEAITRNSRGLNHFARWCFNTYLGKVGLSYHSVLLLVLILLQGNIAIPLKNESGTGDLLAIPLFTLIGILLLLWLIKSRSKLSMIKRYQSNSTESNANGYISYYAFLFLITLDLVFIVGSIRGKVNILLYMQKD